MTVLTIMTVLAETAVMTVLTFMTVFGRKTGPGGREQGRGAETRNKDGEKTPQNCSEINNSFIRF